MFYYIYFLFNCAINTSEYTSLMDWMISELLIGMDVEGSGCGLI
jgi:hypothetical protein